MESLEAMAGRFGAPTPASAPPRPVVVVGVDIGQKADPTAIIVVELVDRPTGRSVPDPYGLVGPTPEVETTYVARHLERLPLGTSYPRVAERLDGVVRKLLRREPPPSVDLVADSTGVGLPVLDIVRGALHELPCGVTGVVFTYGTRADRVLGRSTATVGKAYLVSRLQALLQTGCIALPRTAEAAALAHELEAYEIKVHEDGDTRFGAFRVGQHDDLVTALGLACLDDPRRHMVEFLPALWD